GLHLSPQGEARWGETAERSEAEGGSPRQTWTNELAPLAVSPWPPKGFVSGDKRVMRARSISAMADFFSQSTFVIEQKRKLFELRNQYRIFDEAGAQIGAVEQVAQSPLAIIARFGTDLDAMLPTTLELRDAAGTPLLRMHKRWFRLTLTVSKSDGTTLGSIAKRIRMGKARFTIADQSGSELGELRAQNWRAKDFTIVDQASTEIATATKKWRGLATEMFTDADTYMVSLQPYASEPLRSLAVAAALTIDVILKQSD
ncbi:MAG: LURP-one-related/scramblase family protein, partial [Acidimicrobiia bacterium]